MLSEVCGKHRSVIWRKVGDEPFAVVRLPGVSETFYNLESGCPIRSRYIQPKPTIMQQTTAIPYGRISIFFVFILALLTWGFYRTYIIFFPSFKGFSSVQHFHGAMMMTWMTMLIIQPLLIRFNKITIHRTIGKLSFVLAPLLIVSIFLITKMVYVREDPPLPHDIKIGEMALSLSNLLAFAFLYSMAIANRRYTYAHMRYMIGTSLLMIGPGLGRALIIYFNVPGEKAIDYVLYLEVVIAAAIMFNDVIHKRSFRATFIVLGAVGCMCLLWKFRMGALWQNIGEFVAKNLF